MEVTVLLLFVSLMLVVLSVLFFLTRAKDGDFEHGDRLSLLPLESDGSPHPAMQMKGEIDESIE